MSAVAADMTDGTMRQARGFTLVEMLAVLAVITILAMIVLDQCVIRTVPPLRRFFS